MRFPLQDWVVPYSSNYWYPRDMSGLGLPLNNMPKNIFQLALNFYRAPTQFGDLLDSSQPVPEGVADLLKFLSGSDTERKAVLSKHASMSGDGELIDAISYFVEEVLLVPGADYYSLMGLQPDASAEQVRDHYQMLISLFYQEEQDAIVNWSESASMRINQAYSVLRDAEKRRVYDDKLLASGRRFTRFDPAGYKKVERKRGGKRGASQGKSTGAPQSRLLEDSTFIADGFKKGLSEAAKQKTVTMVAPVEGGLAKAINLDPQSASKDIPKILICDDSATVRASLAKALANDFRCLRARNGDEGLRMLQDNPDIQLVLTDLEMPEMNGYELIERIRKDNNARRANLPIVVVTSMTDIKAKQKALGAGASDFLAKGTDYVEILARVRVHYRLAQSMAESIVPAEPKLHALGDNIGGSSKADKSVIDLSGGVNKSVSRERDLASQDLGDSLPGLVSRIPQPVLIGGASLLAVALIALLFSGGEKEQVTAPTLAESTVTETTDTAGVIQRKTDTSTPESTIAATEPGIELTSGAASAIKEPVSTEPASTNQTDVMTSLPAKPESPEVVKEVPLVKPVKPAKVTAPVQKKEAKKVVAVKGADSSVTAPVKPVSVAKPVTPKVVAKKPVTKKPAAKTPPKVVKPAKVPAPVVAKPVKKKPVVVAKAKKAAPAPAKPLISQRELSILMFKFVRAYEEGNLFQFLGLFDSNARTEDRIGVGEIRKDYELLFSRSDVRQFVISDLKWIHDGRNSVGKGKFEVKIKPRGDSSLNSYIGKVTFHVVKRSDEVFISELYHTYSK